MTEQDIKDCKSKVPDPKSWPETYCQVAYFPKIPLDAPSDVVAKIQGKVITFTKTFHMGQLAWLHEETGIIL